VLLCVRPLILGRYGAFADAVLIAIQHDEAEANSRCQRLRDQQAET
jgi:hypothetical protein